MTTKLYQEDSFLSAFRGVVQSCTPCAGGFAVVLDATAFYPEGGGQPCDTGTLGGASVTDVHEQDGLVVHTVSAPLTVGETVEGAVDFDRRRDHMEQHTGEHILSGTLHRLFGAENVGFHIGSPWVRMDMSVELTAEDLARAETEANALIRQDVPVSVLYPTPEELAELSYRSKKEIEGRVRIVEIAGGDVCACCGTHLRTTGQVGLIKVVSAQKYKGGTRLAVACGGRALAFVQGQQNQIDALSVLLSAKPEGVAEAGERLFREHAALKFAKTGLENRYFEALAATVNPGDAPVLCEDGLDSAALARLARLLTARTDGLCALFSPGGSGLFYVLARREGDVRAAGKALNAQFEGRGGGKPGLCQGSLAQMNFEKIREFLYENAF